MILEGILDPSPVPAPALARTPAGKPMVFGELVRLARMPDVVSTNTPPIIMVHAGERDFKVPVPGRPIYCIAGATLPILPEARAREIMRRLAYGYLDWAARETVSRYHRDLKRSTNVETKTDGLPATVRIRRLIRSNPGITIGEIARRTGIVQPNVSRAVAQLQSNGEIMVSREGRHARCSVSGTESTEILAQRK
ncbi:MarR family transcriptional regulator [Methylorubrum thiocyanatum]|uniref:MarR family transcriptional regulator n=1 Tax=Methylorubrum thiocyanatum TaxID=47958 RepID=UPI00383B938A